MSTPVVATHQQVEDAAARALIRRAALDARPQGGTSAPRNLVPDEPLPPIGSRKWWMLPNPYWAPSLRDMIPLLLHDFVVVLGITLLILITIGAFTGYPKLHMG